MTITVSKKSERLGVVLGLLGAALWGLFPVAVSRGVIDIPPLFFAAVSALLACLGALVYALFCKTLGEIKDKRAWAPLIMVTLCNVVLPFILFFIGARHTSGVNTSFLLLTEIIFTVLFTPFIGEKTTFLKIAGAGGVFLGALLISYQGGANWGGWGDALIVLSVVPYPIGNFFSKRALNYVSTGTILFVRFFIGGLILLLAAAAYEPGAFLGAASVIKANLPLILFNGLVLLGLGKVIWYESLKRLDVSKAVSLAMAFPVFSLLALIFLGAEIGSREWAGIFVMALGVIATIIRPSTNPLLTKYAPLD